MRDQFFRTRTTRRVKIASIVAATTIALGALAGATAAKPTSGQAGPSRPRQVFSIKDSPGYYATPDPESMSVVIGRRLDAPIVRRPFHGGTTSLDALGRAVCRALHRGQRDSLTSLCVSDDEFRDVLWREFPQSRPATGLTWVDAWTILGARLNAGCGHAIRDHGGHYYEFVRIECDSLSRYRNFKLHSRLTLVVKDDLGQIQRWQWLRAVAEHAGRFKIYSTDD